MIVRGVAVAIIALLLAVQVVRNAAVGAVAESSPALAAKAWPGHPSVAIASGMIAIANAAREGEAVDGGTLATIYNASEQAPLAPQPFLVRGVQAQLSGDPALAERAFLAAQWRDGRSLPARYFLADHYFRNADARRGLAEVAVLSRLVPHGAAELAPYVASYARDRANWPALRTLFRAEPALETEGLIALARDAKNAGAVLALSDPRNRSAESPWLAVLVDSLGRAGQYGRARAIWSAVAHVPLPPGMLVYDPQFRDADAPPPFNWALTSSTVGLAERQAGRGLHVIFYGQEDGTLASQLLVLPAGRYRLATDAPNPPDGASSLSWSLVCASSNATLASIPLDRAIVAPWQFAVPADCPAQRLELAGSAPDVSRQADLTIRAISLVREQPHG